MKRAGGVVALGAVPSIAHAISKHEINGALAQGIKEYHENITRIIDDANKIKEQEINEAWAKAIPENNLRTEIYDAMKRNSNEPDNRVIYHRKSDYSTIILTDHENINKKITNFNIPIGHLEIIRDIAKGRNYDPASSCPPVLFV